MATVGLKDPRVEPLVQEVEKKLRKLNEDSLERSFWGSGGGDSYFVWSRIKEIGKELEEIGGRNLVTAAINKIRREQTMMSEQLELTWLGKRISRLP